MKVTTKSSMALVALLAASTVGGTFVSAAGATELDSTGKVTVGDSTDTKDPKEYGIDPETTKGKLYTIPDVNFQPEDVKGPLKMERTSNFNFGNIESSASEIVQPASALVFDKQLDDKGVLFPETDTANQKLNRGAIVQFADTRTEKYGYSVKAKMSQQFKLKDKADELSNATITFNNAIIKSENVVDDAAKMPTYTKGNLVLKQDKELVEFASVKKETAGGKGRYALEFGQSPTYNKDLEGVDKTGTAGTSANSVLLTIPNKTASDMKKGDYEAKVTWVIEAAEN